MLFFSSNQGKCGLSTIFLQSRVPILLVCNGCLHKGIQIAPLFFFVWTKRFLFPGKYLQAYLQLNKCCSTLCARVRTKLFDPQI